LSDAESFSEFHENIQNEESNLCKSPNTVMFLVITSTNIKPETFRCGLAPLSWREFVREVLQNPPMMCYERGASLEGRGVMLRPLSLDNCLSLNPADIFTNRITSV
jgi:hypothetical protein